MTDLDDLLRRAVDTGLTVGATAAVRTADGVVQTSTYGAARLEPLVAVDRATVFDLASLTKVVATTPCLAVLHDRGELDPDDPLDRFLPSPDPRITLRSLLRHEAGLWEWQPLYLRSRRSGSTLELITGLPLRYAPGTERHYSDLGMILLGAVVEAVTGVALDEAVGELVTRPLAMADTTYRPPDPRAVAATSLGDRIERHMVATGVPYPVVLTDSVLTDAGFTGWRDHRLVGVANDGNCAHAMGGVSGHAGLFSTVDDLLRLGTALVEPDPAFLSPAAIATFLTPGPDGQALGFLHRDGRRGPAYWHSGFTGTRLLVEPTDGRVVVLLTNRLHADHATPYPPDATPVWEELLALA